MSKHLISILFINFFNLTSGQIIINEVMSKNTQTIVDQDKEYSDWIELYNNSEQTIDLEKWSITDNRKNPKKWLFPELKIKPNEYLIIWASGKDIREKELHTNFKLKSKGEGIYLFNSSGVLIDKVPSMNIPGNHSLGKLQGDTLKHYYF